MKNFILLCLVPLMSNYVYSSSSSSNKKSSSYTSFVMSAQTATAFDLLRLKQLQLELSAERYDELTTEFHENKHLHSFELHTESWKERQLLHILAAQAGLYSRKQLTAIPTAPHCDDEIVCRYCWLLWEGGEECCMACHGTCPKCGQHEAYAGPNPRAFIGSVLISHDKLKLGRKKRRRRNCWKYGKYTC